MKNRHVTHVTHHLAVQTVSVVNLMVKQFVHACQNLLGRHLFADLSVLSLQNVHKIKLVLTRNAQTLAQELAV